MTAESESCDVGWKSDLFRGIWLSEQLLLGFWVLSREINSRFCSKLQQQMFLLVSGRHVGAHLAGAPPAWRLHTNLYKFGENVSPHIFHKKVCYDLNLGESLCVFTFFVFPDSGLNLLHVLIFYFHLFWMAWHWKPAISMPRRTV